MYKLFKDPFGINNVGVIKDGNMAIPFNEDNVEYKIYLKWIEQGNTPLPADE